MNTRVIIIRDGNTVIVDGERHEVDCSNLPGDFHALQWNGTSGEIEYAAVRCEHCGVRSKKANEFIRDLAPFQPYVDAWQQAKTAAAEAKAMFTRQAQEVGADAAGQQG